MDSQKDDVKVTIKKDEENTEPKKTTAKKTTKKKVVRRKKKIEAPEKVVMEAKEQPFIKKEEPKKEKTVAIVKTSKISYALTVFVSVAVTAVIAGGGIYIWQQKVSEQSMFRVKQDSYSLKNDLENRLSGLKNKLQGVEVENSDLKNQYKDLESKASLLDGAVKKYNNSELGVSFLYPATFGEVKMTITKGVEGKVVRGEFTNNNQLIFGGVTEDYIKSSSSSDLLETTGFLAKKDKYYIKTNTGEELENEIVPAEVLNDNAIIVNNNSFVAIISENEEERIENEDGEVEAVLGDKVEVNDLGLGQNIGAIINLNNDTYQGLAFINMDFGALPFEDFKELVKGVEIK